MIFKSKCACPTLLSPYRNIEKGFYYEILSKKNNSISMETEISTSTLLTDWATSLSRKISKI